MDQLICTVLGFKLWVGYSSPVLISHPCLTSGYLRNFLPVAEGYSIAGQAQSWEKTSNLLMLHLLTSHWSEQVRWPSPKSRIKEVHFVNYEVMTRVRLYYTVTGGWRIETQNSVFYVTLYMSLRELTEVTLCTCSSYSSQIEEYLFSYYNLHSASDNQRLLKKTAAKLNKHTLVRDVRPNVQMSITKREENYKK